MDFSTFLPGAEKPEKIEVLIKLSNIRSEKMLDAIRYHLLKGSPVSVAAVINEVDESNLRRAMDKLEKVAELVEEAKDIDWPGYQMTRFKKVS